MEKSQIICIVTLVIYIIALIFFLCGFGGPAWLTLDSIDLNAGLWESCIDGDCEKIELGDQEDWFIACAVLMIFALIGAIVSGVTFLWLPITAVSHCVTGGLTLLAIIIFAASYEDDFGSNLDLGWAFALGTLAAILFLVNGIIMAVFAFMSGCDMTRRPFPCVKSS